MLLLQATQPAVMYIRTTKTHTTGDKPGYSYRLVHSERSGDKVQQKTLLNLGTDYRVPKENWKQVADLAEQLLDGQRPLFSPAVDIMAAAEDLVRRLHARGFQPGRQADTARDDRSATVDLDTLDHEDSRSVGCERICLQALEELGFQELLRSLGASARDSRLAVALVVAKMINPSSEREALRWLQDDSTTLELLALDGGKGISLSKLYRINDLLWKHRQSLQQGLFLRERLLLDIPDAIVFYDLSNTFYTARPNDTLRRFGRSKQKRNDCPLVSLALLLDGAGFPRSCEILPGNISEPGTLQDAMGRLEAVCEDSSAKPTVIMDAGIATEENLTWLRQQHYNWICVSREGQPQPPEGVAELTLTTSAGQQVQAWKLASKDDEARLYAVSAGKKITANAILKKNRQQCEAALQHLHDGLSKPGFLKNYDRVQQSIGRIMQRYPQVSRQYDVRVTKDTTTKGSATRGVGTKASTVTFSRKQQYDDATAGVGSYVLRTSHSDWNLERILRAYWRLTEIEATFRSLKSELGLRPIWHSKDSRISSHLFITVLAYHGVHLIRTRLKAQGINLSWQSIRTRMRSWVRITTTVRQVNGALLVNRQDVRPLAKVTMISRAAGVEPRIHRRKSRVAK